MNTEIERILKTFPELDEDKLLKAICAIHNLKESRTTALEFVARILPHVEQRRAEGRIVRSVTLYEEILRRYETPLVTHMAAYLWREGSVTNWLDMRLNNDPVLERHYLDAPGQLREDLRTEYHEKHICQIDSAVKAEIHVPKSIYEPIAT